MYYCRPWANDGLTSDFDAQLVRVEERIANKILPDWFVDKKKDLLRRKAARE